MIVNCNTFKDQIALLGLAVEKGAIISKYNARSIVFNSVNGNVYAYTCDNKSNIKMLVGQDNDFFAALDYATFASFIKSCEGDNITLEINKDHLMVKTSQMKGKFAMHPAKTFAATGIPDPEIKNYQYTLTNEINVKPLLPAIDQNHDVEEFRNIYFGDALVASDADNVIKINNKVFNKDFLLSINSINILNSIHNIKYDYNGNKLYIKSDELWAALVIDYNQEEKFPYTGLIDLFNNIQGNSTTINSKELLKALSVSKLFNNVPNLVFNKKGIFLQIKLSDFIYKLSDNSCENRVFKMTDTLAKQIASIGETVTIYYSTPNLIKCEANDISGIFSVEEISNES